MKHDKCKVFFPAVITMVLLHLSSVVLGTIFPLLFSQKVIIYFSVILFFVFGVLMLYDAYNLEEKNTEEKMNELQEELENEGKEKNGLSEKLVESKELKEVSVQGKAREISPGTAPHEEAPSKETFTKKATTEEKPSEGGFFASFIANPYFHLVILLFVGECGDRTQIAAIVLTATHNAWGVAAGGSLVLFTYFPQI